MEHATSKQYFLHHPLVATRAEGCHATPTKLPASHGFVSSHVAYESGCGSVSSPWLLEASPGQRIRVSLLDFGWDPSLPADQAPSSHCSLYGYISERSININMTLCGGRSRQSQVYTSTSGSLQIQIVRNPAEETSSRFLLQYEGKAQFCLHN